MQFTRFLYFAAALTGALSLVACAPVSNEAEAAANTMKQDSGRKPAPDFALKDSNGATVKLSDYKGKAVLLDFWATWCGPCKIEIPWFTEFEQTYKNRGFAVLGVSMDEDGWEVVKPYLQEHRVNYRVVLGNDEVGQAFGGVDSLPTTFLIDRSGRIAFVHIGLSTSKDGFKNEISQLLDARAAAGAPLVGAAAFLAGPGAR